MSLFGWLRSMRSRRRLAGARGSFTGTRKAGRDESLQAPTLATDSEEVVARSLVIVCVLALWAGSVAYLVYSPTYTGPDYIPGEISKRYVYSEAPFRYDDLRQTRLKREQIASQVPPVFRISSELYDHTRAAFRLLHARVLEGTTPAPEPDSPRPDTGERSVQRALEPLEKSQRLSLEYVLASDTKRLRLRDLLSSTVGHGVASVEDVVTRFGGSAVGDDVHVMDSHYRKYRRRVDDLLTPKKAADQVVTSFTLQFPENSGQESKLLKQVLAAIIVPNLTFDAEATEASRRQAAERVGMVTRDVPVGELLLTRGQVVKPEDLLLLRKHGEAVAMERSVADQVADLLYYGVLCLAMLLAGVYWLREVEPRVTTERSIPALITTVLLLQMLLNRTVHEVALNYNPRFPYAVLPFAWSAMLLVQLAGIRVAITSAVYAGLVAGLHHEHSVEIALIAWFASLAGGILMERARRRFHAIRAGLAAGATVFLAGLIFLLYDRFPTSQLTDVLPTLAGFSFACGLITSTVASAMLPAFEYVFGLTTEISLLELSDLNHPLLKRLQMEAPGTYHHSLVVATIAEQAAEAVGANPLLARVCAYFHDIGKLERPEYFVENNAERNRHDLLRPTMSTRVILNHVKSGLELAQRHKLIKPIREAISQHHGTSLVSFFYHQALAEARADSADSADKVVQEQEFRYPGPRPVRKEISIISLADPCEAASRTLEKPTPKKLADLVDDIVIKRIRDGQLGNANLTFRELTVVRNSIIRTLSTMMHGRVKYPETDGPEDATDADPVDNAGEKTPAAPAEASAEGD